jgi:hydrogenase expression/formation protein HypE
MDRVTLAHGSGGKPMHELIDSLFLKEFSNKVLREKKDSAVFAIGDERLAFTTDSYVVSPLFFPGGDIGMLAVNGTVNDLSVCGARPLFLSCAIIAEEGLDVSILRRVTSSMKRSANEAGAQIVTGDTKVVERGKCDRLFVTTSGIGIIEKGRELSIDMIKPGDVVLVNGQIGDQERHGAIE